MELPGTKRFISKGFELGTTLREPIWSTVYFPAKLSLKLDTFRKKKVKQPYLKSITRNSNSTDKLDVDGALNLLPPLHQCSVLRVFKAT